VTIDFVGNELAVSGYAKEDPRLAASDERTKRGAPFAFSITMPAPIDADGVDAALVNGVLKVIVPKSKPSEYRRIELK
jgi:HSP20 family protein